MLGVVTQARGYGYDVLLLEQSDFGKGTSSRSTKLVHGGVRYLEQGNVPLVMSALKERGLLRRNAPHLVHDLALVVPNYSWWEAPFYGIGMKVYDLLAGKYGFGRSRILSSQETIEQLPNLQTEGLGWNAQVGFMYKITPDVQFGVSYESPTTIVSDKNCNVSAVRRLPSTLRMPTSRDLLMDCAVDRLMKFTAANSRMKTAMAMSP